MKTLLSAILLLHFSSNVCADFFPPPFQAAALSKNCEFLARIDESRKVDEQGTPSKRRLSIHQYNPKTRMYEPKSEFAYGEHPGSGFLFVSNNGKHVVGVNIGRYIGKAKLGVRLYSHSGKLLRKWPISEFLTEQEIEGCAKTGSTTQWFMAGEFDHTGKIFTFHGPATRLKPWGSSYSLLNGVKPGLEFEFTIDLEKLQLTRVKQPNLGAERATDDQAAHICN